MRGKEREERGPNGELLVDRPAPHVVTLTINRPQRHNAFDIATWQLVADTMREINGNDDVRCVVFQGAGGRAFSTGADISEFETHRRTREQAVAYGATVSATWDAIIACPHPIIAVIDGVCVGGGLELACLADMRIASDDSRFGMPLKRLGLVLAYPELEPIFRVAGYANTMELLLAGELHGAEDAKRLGLISRVEPKARIGQAGLELATSIAEGAPLSARWHKRFVRRLESGEPLTDAARAECFECFETEDFEIGYRAFLDKKTPRFVGR